MLIPLTYLALGLCLVALALRIHTRLLGFLPEDWPGEGRKRHQRPTPMVGMVPAAITIIILFTFDRLYLPWAVLLAALTGAVDDYLKDRHRGGDGKGIDWRVKAFGLLGASTLATWPLMLEHELEPIAALVTGLLIFLLANATNFLDNTNGVACSAGGAGLLLASGATGPVAMIGWAFVAVLPFNWPRGRVFLGDSGALAFGTVLGYVAVARGFRGDSFDFVAALAPVFVFTVDMAQVVGARLYLGFAPWVGDRRHLTHILMRYHVRPAWVAPIFLTVAIAAWFVLEEINR